MQKKATSPERGSRSYSVPPVVRAIKVLRYIAAGNSMANQAHAARAIGINRTTLLRILHTLEAEGLIEHQRENGDFVLGAGVLELAGRKISSLDVTHVATPVLARLAAMLGLSCHLGVLDGCEILYVVRQAPNVPLVSNVHVGTRLPAHAATMGRAILAHMPWEQVVERFGERPLVPVTSKTATTLADLALQLEHDRAAGLSDSRSHFEVGIDSIGAPIFDHSGKVIAAINVSGPERAFHTHKGRRREIAAALIEAAREICARMGHVGGLPGFAPTFQPDRNEAVPHGQH
jgi:DNA-binding IclR family transcriptional regulator